MGAVYEEFQRDLVAWGRRYRGDPRGEIVHFLLLALEREEIVSVSYRESLMEQRLDAMPIDPEARDLIRHALIWAWKDEEMHTIYLRGAIFRLGSRWLRWKASLRQLAGAVGGWAGSVRQHVRWRDAPLSRSLATLITWAGVITGQVPRDVREYLRFRPFRDFCEFNLDAELTAAHCYRRMVEIAADLPDLPATLVADLKRVEVDEDRHAAIFGILLESLDENDRLVPGVTPATLAARIGAVGDFFLPRSLRPEAGRNPLGAGGTVWVGRGADASEKIARFRKILGDSGLADRLADRAEAAGKPVGQTLAAIKPTFMLGYHRSDTSVITDPELVADLARFLREAGCGDVAVIESPNIYDKFFRNRTVADVARYFGYDSPDYRLVDAAADQVAHDYHRGMAQYTVAKTWRDADLRISFSKLRSHPVELALLSVGNIEWVGARCDEYVFVERQAHRETAIMMLLDEFPAHFALIDGYDQAADGLVGVMGCPRPRSPRRFYAGADALAVDLVAFRHLGLTDPRESRIFRAAIHWFGDPTGSTTVVGDDLPVEGWRGPYHSELSTLLSIVSYPVYVHGSGRGSLFVPQMDEQAFPLLEPERPLLRIGRSGVRRLLGLHLKPGPKS